LDGGSEANITICFNMCINYIKLNLILPKNLVLELFYHNSASDLYKCGSTFQLYGLVKKKESSPVFRILTLPQDRSIILFQQSGKSVD
jgi:hypothetical protein